MKSWLCAAALSAALLPSIGSAQAPKDSRASLIRYLDGVAATDLAARKRAITAIRSREDVQRRQAEVRAKVLTLIGGLPERSGPIVARVTGRTRAEGYRTENVIFDSMPGQHVTATLFLPLQGAGPFPAIVISPGHGQTGRQGDYSFAANFARNGVAALTYDIVGEGERLQYFDPDLGASKVGRPTGEHSMAAFHSWLLGGHVARYFIFDGMRAVDYLASRPEVDAARIGAFGCSGGGTVTAYLAALDERVKARRSLATSTISSICSPAPARRTANSRSRISSPLASTCPTGSNWRRRNPMPWCRRRRTCSPSPGRGLRSTKRAPSGPPMAPATVSNGSPVPGAMVRSPR